MALRMFIDHPVDMIPIEENFMENQEQNEFDSRQLWRAFRRFWYVVLVLLIIKIINNIWTHFLTTGD